MNWNQGFLIGVFLVVLLNIISESRVHSAPTSKDVSTPTPNGDLAERTKAAPPPTQIDSPSLAQIFRSGLKSLLTTGTIDPNLLYTLAHELQSGDYVLDSVQLNLDELGRAAKLLISGIGVAEGHANWDSPSLLRALSGGGVEPSDQSGLDDLFELCGMFGLSAESVAGLKTKFKTKGAAGDAKRSLGDSVKRRQTYEGSDTLEPSRNASPVIYINISDIINLHFEAHAQAKASMSVK